MIYLHTDIAVKSKNSVTCQDAYQKIRSGFCSDPEAPLQ